MKSTNKGIPPYFINGANLFPKIPLSPQAFPTSQSHSISRIHQNSLDTPAYYDPNQSSGMTFGFGLQVMKIDTKLRERTVIKPITYSSLQPNKKFNAPRLPPSASKLQRREGIEAIDFGSGIPSLKEMPNIKLSRPPKLPQISKVQETGKPKAFSQNDISTRSRDVKRKLDKLSSTSKKKGLDEKNTESSYSIYGPGTETKRGVETILRMREMEDIAEKEIKPVEVKSLNIVQRKLMNNRDAFEFRDVVNPRRESALGSYLSKALQEVTNINNGALTQTASPRDNFGLEIKEIKGQVKEKEKEKEKIAERKPRVRKGSSFSKEAMPAQEQQVPVQAPMQIKSEVRLVESKAPSELKKMLKRPNSKVNFDRKKKEKTSSVVKEEEDTSKIEEYKFEVPSDDDEDLSLDEYLKAKKDNQENYDTEDIDFDYQSELKTQS